MKPAHLITLAVILIIAAFWFAYESESESSQTEQSTHSRNMATPDEQASSSRTSSRKLSVEKLTDADWAQVADDLKYLSKQIDTFKPSPALEKRLRKYTKSELIDAKDSLRLSGLGVREQVNIHRYLLTLIVQLNPADFCRDPYAAGLSQQSRLWWERLALTEWIRLSPEDAIAWHDSIAEDSRQPKQITALKHNLFSALVVTDFEKAKARFLATPKDQQHRMMQNFDGFGSYWTRDDFQNHNIAGRFAELARLQEPNNPQKFIVAVISGRGEQDRPAAISRIQESLKDWNKRERTWLPAITVADYFDKIDATPKEQELCFDAIMHQFKYYKGEGDPATFREKFTAEVRKIRSRN